MWWQTTMMVAACATVTGPVLRDGTYTMTEFRYRHGNDSVSLADTVPGNNHLRLHLGPAAQVSGSARLLLTRWPGLDVPAGGPTVGVCVVGGDQTCGVGIVRGWYRVERGMVQLTLEADFGARTWLNHPTSGMAFAVRPEGLVLERWSRDGTEYALIRLVRGHPSSRT